jgi:hypothetical protein
MEPEGSLPCSQEPSTGPCPEPDQAIPPNPLLLSFILILCTYLRLGIPIGVFMFGFTTNILYAFLCSPIRATCPVPLMILDLIILIILGEEYKFEAPHYAVFSSLLSLHHSLVQIFSAPCSQTPSVQKCVSQPMKSQW